MTAFLGNMFGAIFKFIYDLVSKTGAEPANFSFYAMSIIIITILFKLALLPMGINQAKSTKKMQKIQPLMQDIQKKYKDDPATQQAKMMELYKEHNYNPMSGCLPLLIQLPIIIAFFKMLRNPVEFAFKDPTFYASIAKNFLWIPNLEQPDVFMWGLPLLAGLTTFLQSRVMMTNMAADPKAQQTQNMMNLFLPVMIFISAKSFPAGLALYWVLGNIFQIVQTLVINKSFEDTKEETD